MMPKIIIALTLIHMCVLLEAADQDRWIWNSYGRQQKSDGNFERIRVPVSDRRGDDRGPNRFPSDDDIDRYEVKEPTTERPVLTKPQKDELDAFNDDPRYGAGGQGFGDPNGFAYPGGGFIPRPPSGNPANGVLVGPGGPTGIIGRPKGNPANGILVGPGGPTGVIGRPYPGQFPGGSGYYPGGSGFYPGGQGQFPGGPGQFPGGPGFLPGRPGQYPGGGQGFYPGGQGQYPGGAAGYPGQFPGGFQGQYPGGPGGFAGGQGGFPGGPGGFAGGPGGFAGGPGGFSGGQGGFAGGPGGFPGQYPLGYPGYDQGQYPEDDGYTPYNNQGVQFDGNNNGLGRRGNKDKTKDDRRSILKSL